MIISITRNIYLQNSKMNCTKYCSFEVKETDLKITRAVSNQRTIIYTDLHVSVKSSRKLAVQKNHINTCRKLSKLHFRIVAIVGS